MAVTEPDVVVAMTATPALRIDTEDTPADFPMTRVQGGLLHQAIGSVREPHSTRPTPPWWPVSEVIDRLIGTRFATAVSSLGAAS
jgi:hypothetical protein